MSRSHALARGRARTIVVASAAAAMIGCAGKGPVREVTPQELLARAEARILNEDYVEAIELLTKLTVDHPGVAYIDRVVFQLGRAQLESGSYAEAIAQFQRLGRDYPFSELADDASFLIGECSFRQRGDPSKDPKNAEQARTDFRRFLRAYPESDRAPEARAKLAVLSEFFAEKAYDNARQYRRLGKLVSAEIYFENVFARYPDSTFTPRTLIELAEVRREMGQTDRACEALRLLRELPASDELDEALERAGDLEAEYRCAAAETTASGPGSTE